MLKFPVDAPKRKVIKTLPNHPKIKASTLRIICTQAGIKREEFLSVYNKV